MRRIRGAQAPALVRGSRHRSGARAAPGGDPSEAHYTARRIGYALSREPGPIGEFQLVVDKQADSDLVSFCGRGVTRLGPTRFELRRRNFRPAQDLAILFLKWNPDLISGANP